MFEGNDREFKMIKDFHIALKDIEPYVKDPRWLRTGKRFSNCSLLVREVWTNWLLCVVLQRIGEPDMTFAEDDKGDGILVCRRTGLCIPTEHVSRLDVPFKEPLADGEDGVIQAIEHKIARGSEYAQGKYLIVFFEGVGEFYRNKIRERIRGKHNFLMVFGVGLLSIEPSGDYVYAVTQFHDLHSVTHIVRIKNDFTDWQVVSLS